MSDLSWAFGGLAAFAGAAVLSIVTVQEPDSQLLACVQFYSAALPILTAFFIAERINPNMLAARTRPWLTRLIDTLQLTGMLTWFIGTVALFWHFGWATAAVFIVTGGLGFVMLVWLIQHELKRRGLTHGDVIPAADQT